MSFKGNKHRMISTSITLKPELHAMLHELAERQYRSASSLASQILDEGLTRLNEERQDKAAERARGRGEGEAA